MKTERTGNKKQANEKCRENHIRYFEPPINTYCLKNYLCAVKRFSDHDPPKNSKKERQISIKIRRQRAVENRSCHFIAVCRRNHYFIPNRKIKRHGHATLRTVGASGHRAFDLHLSQGQI
ncbi:MAG: hypothetical protein ACTTKO_01490 [Candidatus Limimorpha sp.]